jgi:hypothetical protein
MLLDRAATITTKINTYQNLKNSADEADLFGTRAKQFGTVAQQIAGLRETLRILADAGVPVCFQPSDGLGYAQKARQLRNAIRENPATVNDPPFDIKHGFTDRLTGIAVAGLNAANAAWKAYVDKRAAFGADEVLSALGQVQQFRASVATIRQIRGEVSALSSARPPNLKAAITKLDSLINQHEIAWKSIAATDIPPSIVAFIRAAASGNALLSAYTSEVQSWLERHKLLDAFRIKLR